MTATNDDQYFVFEDFLYQVIYQIRCVHFKSNACIPLSNNWYLINLILVNIKWYFSYNFKDFFNSWPVSSPGFAEWKGKINLVCSVIWSLMIQFDGIIKIDSVQRWNITWQTITRWKMNVILFCCLFGVLRPTGESSLIWRRHHYRFIGFSFWAIPDLISIEQASIACHTYCAMSHPFL